MSVVPGLQRLARRCSPDPEAGLVEVLQLLCEQLGTDSALLGHSEDGLHTVRLAVGAAGRLRGLEVSSPAGEGLRVRTTDGGSVLVRDVAAEPDLAGQAAPTGARCYAATTVRGPDGTGLGVLELLGRTPNDRLDGRDVAVLEGLATVVGELYPAYLAPATSVSRAVRSDGARDDLETLTRPLLEALQELSGIASTYLTVVHEDEGVQEVRFARNTVDGFAVPEQLRVAWEDTLCKRALDEGRSCTIDVPGVWGDSQAARDAGIVTYVSVPVRLHDGRVWGTLCAADSAVREGAAQHLPTLALFARLISAEVERSADVERERAVARRAREEADTDPLTRCASRRTVEPWLEQAMAARTAGQVVALAFVDVDSFKEVNDRLGHAAGDAVLAELGQRLLIHARPGDLVARLGGDELVVAARLPREAAAALQARVRDAAHFTLAVGQGEVEVRCSTGLATSDEADDPAALLHLADLDMYRHKRLVIT